VDRGKQETQLGQEEHTDKQFTVYLESLTSTIGKLRLSETGAQPEFTIVKEQKQSRWVQWSGEGESA